MNALQQTDWKKLKEYLFVMTHRLSFEPPSWRKPIPVQNTYGTSTQLQLLPEIQSWLKMRQVRHVFTFMLQFFNHTRIILLLYTSCRKSLTIFSLILYVLSVVSCFYFHYMLKKLRGNFFDFECTIIIVDVIDCDFN